MIAGLMILVDCTNVPGEVHDWCTRRKCKPKQPVIPARAADHEFGYLLVKKAPRKDKIVHPLRGPLPVGLEGKVADRVFPTLPPEIEQCLDIDVPAAAGGKKVVLQ